MVAREICFRASQSDMLTQVQALQEMVTSGRGEPTLIDKADGSPMDFCFMDVRQYEGALNVRHFDTYSELLDTFFSDRDRIARMPISASC